MLGRDEEEDFLYPYSRYRGQIRPENLVFNANLQEFAQRVNYICNLETNGKITPADAYSQIKELWKQLKSASLGLVPLRGSQKSKVKSQKAYLIGFSLIRNGSFIYAVLY